MKISNIAKKLYEKAIVIDGQLGFEPAMPTSFEQKWQLIDRYHASGVTAVTITLANDESTLEETIFYLARIRKHILDNRDKYILATTAEHILQAKKENKIALRLMFQGTAPIGKNLNLVELFHRLGISSMILAYNIRTPMGDGVIEENDSGLSLLGKQLIAEMNRIGMIIDGSHSSYKTVMDAAKLSSAPIVISHSAIAALHPHARNVKDDQIIAVAQTGGIIGINGLGLLLGDENAPIEKLVDHIEYTLNLVGKNHVAIGLDNLYFRDQFAEFMKNQPSTHPQTYAEITANAMNWKCIQPEQLIEVVEMLLQRGHDEDTILAVLGGNILRVMHITEEKRMPA